MPRDDDTYPALERAVVRITTADGASGTGFFLAPTLVATCAHVASSEAVRLELADGRGIAATTISRYPETGHNGTWTVPDIALLRTSTKSQHLAGLASGSDRIPEDLGLLGYAKGADTEATLTYERPQLLGLDPLGGARLIKLGSCTILPGMSGGLLFGLNDGKVYGIVKRTRQKTAGGGGWAIPIGLLDAYFPDQLGPVRAITVDKSKHRYLRDTIHMVSSIEPRGLPRTRESQDVVLQLDEIYSSLSLVEYNQAELASASDLRDINPLLNFDAHCIDDPAAHAVSFFQDVNPEVRRAPGPRAHRGSPLSLTELLESGNHTVILGDPGSGKTTLLQWLALSHARASLAGASRVEVPTRQVELNAGLDELLDIGPTRLPILVRLAKFAEHLDQAGTEAMGLGDFINSEHVGQLLHEYLASGECLRSEPLLVLLDGLDEVPPHLRHRVVSETQRLAAESQLAREGATSAMQIIVTSRHSGYRQASLRRYFQHAALEPLSDQAVALFVHKWVRAVRRAHTRGMDQSADQLEAAARDKAELILAALHRQTSIEDLARTPLMLTVISLVFDETGDFPRTRAGLLDAMTRILVLRRSTGFSYPVAVRLLSPFALWMHENRPTGVATIADFRDQIERHASRVERPAGMSISELATQFTVTAQEQFGVIIEKGHGLVGFQHRVFQEFLVANEAKEMDDPFTWIASRIDEPAWREVGTLLAGVLGLYSAKDVAKYIYSFVSSAEVASTSIRQVQLLLTAGECLMETDQSLPQLAGDLFDSILRTVVAVQRGGMPQHVRDEVVSSLRLISRSYENTFDTALAHLYFGADRTDRAYLAALSSKVGGRRPLWMAGLEELDASAKSAMVDRQALAALRRSVAGEKAARESAADERDASDDPMPGRIARFLEDYGVSAAYVRDWLDGDNVWSTSAIQGTLADSVGVEVSLVGIAWVWAQPDALSEAHKQVVRLGGQSRGAEMLAYLLARRVGEVARFVLVWPTLPASERLEILGEIARGGARSNAILQLCWRELELFVGAPGEAMDVCVTGVRILSESPRGSLTAPMLSGLASYVSYEGVCRTDIVSLLARSSCPAAVCLGAVMALDSGHPILSDLKRLWAISALEEGSSELGAIKLALEACLETSGLWQERALHALARERSFSALSAETLRYIADCLHSDGPVSSDYDQSDVSQIAPVLACSVVLSSWQEFQAAYELSGHLALFAASSHECRYLWDGMSDEILRRREDGSPLVGDSPEIVLAAAEVLRRVARYSGLSALDTDNGELPVAISLSGDGALVGLSWAVRGCVPGVADMQPWSPSFSRACLFELSLWVSSIGAVESFDVLLSEIRSLGVLDDRERCVLMLRSHDDLQSVADLQQGFGLSNSDVAWVLLAAGADDLPIYSSSPRSDLPGGRLHARLMALLQEVVGSLDLVNSVVASSVRWLREDAPGADRRLFDASSWTAVRSAILCLRVVGELSPEASIVAARAYGAAAAVRAHLHNERSFTVRMYAFFLGCLYGLLDSSLVRACRRAILTEPGASGYFDALRLVSWVGEDAFGELSAMLVEGGRPLVAAVDVIRFIGEKCIRTRSLIPYLRLIDLLETALLWHDARETCRVGGTELKVTGVLLQALTDLRLGRTAGLRVSHVAMNSARGGLSSDRLPASTTFASAFLWRAERMFKVPQEG